MKYICTHAGSTLLVNGCTYTIKDRSYDHFGCEMWEMNECLGFLFGPWRFCAERPELMATGEHLDALAAMWGVRGRSAHESDASLRDRVLASPKLQAIR